MAFLQAGFSLNEIARRIQRNASSVMRWRDARQRGGSEALKVRSSPWRPARLGPTQRRRLVKLHLKGPIAHGYRTNLWTTARIAEVIEGEFGVHYHRDHI